MLISSVDLLAHTRADKDAAEHVVRGRPLCYLNEANKNAFLFNVQMFSFNFLQPISYKLQIILRGR